MFTVPQIHEQCLCTWSLYSGISRWTAEPTMPSSIGSGSPRHGRCQQRVSTSSERRPNHVNGSTFLFFEPGFGNHCQYNPRNIHVGALSGRSVVRRRLSSLLSPCVGISSPLLMNPSIVATRGYRAKPRWSTIHKDKLSTLMKIQQAHRDALTPSNAGRNMKGQTDRQKRIDSG